MVKVILLVLFYFGFPVLIILACQKWTILNKLGAIVLAYGLGLLIGTAEILPKGSEQYNSALQGRAFIPSAEFSELTIQGKVIKEDKFVNQVASVQDMIPSIVVPLAFPLLLFSLNIKRWIKHARNGFISVALAIVAGVVMVTAGFFIWNHSIPDSWKLAGMFEGIYTGGTPNFVAIKMALNVDPNLFVIVSTYDMVVGAFLVLFFITIGPKIFRMILPEYKTGNGIQLTEEEIHKETAGLEDYRGLLKRKVLVPLLGAVGISVLIFAIGFSLTLLLPMIPKMVVVILSITSLGIVASMIPRINRIEKTFQLGMYFILVFSLTVASMADLKSMFTFGMVPLILFITWCYFGSLILHLILARIFRVDSDNFLITSAAYIFSPPFVPLVANALKNKDVIVTGITGGILGYILGNYIGVALAYALKVYSI